jgi:hypothetical protein
MDRGSFQSLGIITDVGLFIGELAKRLAPEEIREAGDRVAEKTPVARRHMTA